jgi:hypothetical protein
MELSVIQILIEENCLAHERTQNAVLYAVVSAQRKHKSVTDMWICHTYTALTVTYITPTTEWFTTFTRMHDKAFFLTFDA